MRIIFILTNLANLFCLGCNVYCQDKPIETKKKEILEKVNEYLEKQHKLLLEKINAIIDEEFGENKKPKANKKSPGFLGIVPGNLTEDELEDLGIEGGVKIDQIIEDTAAEKAKLEEGDVIVSIDGISVEYVEDLIKILRDKGAGKTIKLIILRDGLEKTVKATLTDPHGETPEDEKDNSKEPEGGGKLPKDELKKKVKEFLEENK